MNDDGDRGLAGADNPYAKPANDLPVAIKPDGRMGRIAGLAFLAMGAFEAIRMVLVWSTGRTRLNIGAIAMLVIGVGLLKRSDSARRWGIGCAGFYLIILSSAAAMFWWLLNTGNLKDGFLDHFPQTPRGAFKAYAFVPVYAALLWLLLHPRTRAAYQRGPTVIEHGEGEGPPPVPPVDAPPPG